MIKNADRFTLKLLRREKRSRQHIAFELYAILFNYAVIEVGAAKGAANRLTGDGADHEEWDKRELMGHLKHDQNGSNRRPDHRPEARTHSCDGKSDPVTRLNVEHKSA